MLNLKKILIFVLVFVMAFSLAACGNQPKAQGSMTPGTYTGVGKGHAGEIEVAVTVTADKIEKIEFTSFPESDFAKEPANKLVDKILKANSAEVDGIAGATVTSGGVLEAVKAALAQAVTGETVPMTTAAQADATGTDAVTSASTDVVVIGAGGAGLSAAISAKEAGANVIVVEKMPLLGGNTKYATGGLNAAGTTFQKEKGIEDSVELFVADTMKGGKDINDKALVTVLAENSASTVEWLSAMGADLSDVGRLGGASVNRSHRPTGGASVGNHLVDVLVAKAQSMGIEIKDETKAVEVLAKDGAVYGVNLESSDGKSTIYAKAIVVASGGFGANNDLVASHRPEYKGYGTTNHPGATGDVFEFMKNIDVQYVDLEQIQTHPTVMPSNNYMITEAVRGNGAILVNRDAERFINEITTRDVVSNALLAQKEGTGFLVFDQGVRESLKAIEGYHKKGFLLEGETLADLAKQLGVDAAKLEATVKEYNESVAAGKDEKFERPDMPRDLAKGPFYAVEVGPAIHHTMGGIKINEKAEVLNKDNNVIAGLYAAGEVTGGIHGANRLGGNALADITVYGRIAGQSAAEFAKK